MDYRKGKKEGYTLVELLMVMAIVIVLISLVSPPILSTYSKTRVKGEERMLEEVFKAISMKAFLRQEPFRIRVEGHTLEAQQQTWREEFLSSTKASPEKLRIKFDYVEFDPLVVNVDGNGFPDVEEVTYSADGQKRKLKLSQGRT